MNWILLLAGLVAGLLSGAVGFGGGMVLLPVVTSLYGIEVAVPICTIAQLGSNLSKVIMGWRDIAWKQVGFFLITAAPLTALGAVSFGFADKQLMGRILCVFLIVFAVMKIIVYNKSDLVNTDILLNGALIAVAMIAGNMIAMRTIRRFHTKTYQRIVAACMIGLSIYLFFTV